jgi:hypothetical protein
MNLLHFLRKLAWAGMSFSEGWERDIWLPWRNAASLQDSYFGSCVQKLRSLYRPRGFLVYLPTFFTALSYHLSRDSAVGIATGYGLDDWEVGFRVPVGSRIFTSLCCPDRLWGPPNTMGTGGSFPGAKRPGREADHSPPTSAEVKKMWIYISTPPYALMA